MVIDTTKPYEINTNKCDQVGVQGVDNLSHRRTQNLHVVYSTWRTV